MKKILNIVLGDMSTGELGIAISFVKNQSSDMYCNYLVVPEEKKVILKENEFNVFLLSKNNTPTENQLKVRKIIEDLSPDMIILFDVFTFEYAQNWTGCNVKFLKKFNIPLASIDEYEYTRTNLKIDYYGIFVKKLPALLGECNYVLKNCPMSVPKYGDIPAEKGKYYYYRVFQELNPISFSERNDLRKKYFGVENNNTKVVFFTTSLWEVSGAYSFACQNQLAKWLGPIVYQYLKDLDSNIVLAHIGAENWELHSDGKLKYIHFNSLESVEFEKAMQASDLFLTYNVVSISLSKAVLYGIPSLVLNNQKIVEFVKLKETLQKRPMWYQKMASEVKKVYPFAASLFGWSNFLKTCMTDNPYLKSFDITNVFNYGKTLEQLKTVLYDESYRREMLEREEAFSTQYFQISSSENVLDDIFGNVK